VNVSPNEARELFSAAYDAELDAQEKVAFDAALASDAALAAEYTAFRATLEVARGDLTGIEPTPDLLPGVQRRLRARSRGRFYADKFAERAGLGMWSPLLVAAITVGVLALLWLALGYFQGVEVRH
jgi:anti-sigma-K factor RskA